MADLLLFREPAATATEPAKVPDQAERERALEITRSFIVEAPAGSGKTGLLIQRLLKLLASDTVTDPSQVLAITFTRKATHELRDRLLQQLVAASGDPPQAASPFDQTTRALAQDVLARDHRLGWELLRHPDRLNISTIDALCAQIARSLPVHTGAVGQSPVEDAASLYAQAARQTLAHLGGADRGLHTALETLLLHRDGDLADCESLIAAMLGWREQWGNLIPVLGEQLTDAYLETVTLPRIERALEQVICRALTRLDRLMPATLCASLADLARRMAWSDGYLGAESPMALCRELRAAPSTAAADLDHWRALAHLLLTKSAKKWRNPRGMSNKSFGFQIDKGHKAELQDLISQLEAVPGLHDALCSLSKLPPLKYPPEQWHVAKALFHVLRRALIELQLVFTERGECDFSEFSLLAHAALEQTSALEDIAAAAGYNLQHLLVDEMQDTSASQYELIRLLTQHWDSHSQTVFLVGDPKQSIYLFRQARVARFLETLNTGRLGDLRLDPLYLTANFRSQPNLVASFNRTFSQIFPSPAEPLDRASAPAFTAQILAAETNTGFAGNPDPEQVTYRAAQPAGHHSPGPEIIWHTAVVPRAASGTAELRRARIRQNAAAIRDLIAAFRSRTLPADRARGGKPAEPWRIAVLVRNRRHLVEIVKALQARPAASSHDPGGWAGPIPFRAVRTEPLAERQEVLDLIALTRALLHPADRTAWLAVLRTPWVGLTLSDLHLLAGADDPSLRTHTVLDLAGERGDLLSADGLERLQLFYKVMHAALAHRGRMPLSRWVDRTWRAFGADACATHAELANIQRFFELLDKLEAQPEPLTIARLDAALRHLFAAESTTPGAVDLMTIHTAKGLEWDLVIVPELEASSRGSSNRLLDWLELDTAPSAGPEIAHGIIAPVRSKGSQAKALTTWMRSIDREREAAERKRLFYVACTRARGELHLFAAPGCTAKGEISPRWDSLLRSAWPAAQHHFAGLASAAAADAETESGELAALAAEALALVPSPEPGDAPLRTIQRIPLDAVPHASTRFGPPAHAAGTLAGFSPDDGAKSLTRPEGSFHARAAGNATHAFLELLAQRIASGASISGLQRELPSWSARIEAILRAAGISPAELHRAATSVLRALTRTLADPDGQWLLSPHPQAASELALANGDRTIRLDRTFLAGASPRSTGDTHLWIVDFKTGSHGADGLDLFLQREVERYGPQLAGYAQHLSRNGKPIRTALYYPSLPRLVVLPS